MPRKSLKNAWHDRTYNPTIGRGKKRNLSRDQAMAQLKEVCLFKDAVEILADKIWAGKWLNCLPLVVKQPFQHLLNLSNALREVHHVCKVSSLCRLWGPSHLMAISLLLSKNPQSIYMLNTRVQLASLMMVWKHPPFPLTLALRLVNLPLWWLKLLSQPLSTRSWLQGSNPLVRQMLKPYNWNQMMTFSALQLSSTSMTAVLR